MSTQAQEVTPEKKSDFDPKQFSADFAKKLDDVATQIHAKVDTIRTERVETKPAKEDDDDYEGIFADEEKKFEKIVEKKLGDYDSRISQRKAYDEACSEWDGKAQSEIPLIASNNEFKEEVMKELAGMPVIAKEKRSDGSVKNLFAPDALYNAAHRVYVKWDRQNKITKGQEFEELDHGGYRPKIRGVEITDVQQQICERLGITSDRAKAIYKPFNARTK